MEHKCQLRVRYNECDMYGHVNHAMYLSYLEYARIEFLKSHGISITTLAENGHRLFIKKISIEYISSAQFDETLEICTKPVAMKNIWGLFQQQIYCGTRLVIEAEIKWACVDKVGKPTRIPDTITRLVSKTE